VNRFNGLPFSSHDAETVEYEGATQASSVEKPLKLFSLFSRSLITGLKPGVNKIKTFRLFCAKAARTHSKRESGFLIQDK
jgi:hypothetical protein